MPSGEVQTDSIVRHALSSGKQVFVPYLYKSPVEEPNVPRSVMNMLQLRSLLDYESLARDSWGIPTLGADTIQGREAILNNDLYPKPLDLILMPGVAFDTDPVSGYIRRLGHGKGFYDYFLQRYSQGQGSQIEEASNTPRTDALLYGLALEEQFLSAQLGTSVPVGEHDSLLHGLVLGSGGLKEGPASKENTA